MRKQHLLFEKTLNTFIQALPYLCLPQHLPAHHLGPGFLHLYTPGGEYLPRKLDPERQIHNFFTYPCMISVLSDIAVVSHLIFTYFPLQSQGRRLKPLLKIETESKWKLQMKNKAIPTEHYTKKKSLKHTFLFPYQFLSNLNSKF